MLRGTSISSASLRNRLDLDDDDVRAVLKRGQPGNLRRLELVLGGLDLHERKGATRRRRRRGSGGGDGSRRRRVVRGCCATIVVVVVTVVVVVVVVAAAAATVSGAERDPGQMQNLWTPSLTSSSMTRAP